MNLYSTVNGTKLSFADVAIPCGKIFQPQRRKEAQGAQRMLFMVY